MATGTSDDERDDELTESTGEEVAASSSDTGVDAADSEATDAAADESDEDAETADDTESDADESDTDGSEAAAATKKPAKRDRKARKASVVDDGKGKRTPKRSEQRDKKAAADTSERRGISKFFSEVMGELKKVVTPTAKELWRYTGVVLGFLVVMMLIVTVLDFGFGYGSSWLFGTGTSLFPEAPPVATETVPAQPVPAPTGN